MKWLTNNLINISTLTPSSVKSGNDVNDLKHYHLSKSFSFNTNSDNLVIEFSTETNIKNFMVCGSNLTSSATISLQGNATDSWSSPTYSASLTLYPNGYFGIIDIDQTFKYYRLVISDSTVTNITLGYIYLGDSLTLPGIDPQVPLKYNTTSSVSYSLTGQSWANTGYTYFTSSFNFPLIELDSYTRNGKTIVGYEDLLEFWLDNQGTRPIIMIIFENNLTWLPPMIGNIAQNSWEFKLNKLNFSLSFNFTETK